MRTIRIMAVAVLFVGSGLALHVALARQQGIKRTDLQRHDLSVPGREVVQVRVDIAPGVLAAGHSHPGEEIVYVIEGTLEYKVEGKPRERNTLGATALVQSSARRFLARSTTPDSTAHRKSISAATRR